MECPARVGSVERVLMSLLLPDHAGGLRSTVNPAPTRQPGWIPRSARAIDAEPLPPEKVIVRDFEVSPSSISDDATLSHRLILAARLTIWRVEPETKWRAIFRSTLPRKAGFSRNSRSR
jgi:hypothetical protein